MTTPDNEMNQPKEEDCPVCSKDGVLSGKRCPNCIKIFQDQPKEEQPNPTISKSETVEPDDEMPVEEIISELRSHEYDWPIIVQIVADKLEQLTVENQRLQKAWDSAHLQALQNGQKAQQLQARVDELEKGKWEIKCGKMIHLDMIESGFIFCGDCGQRMLK